MLARSKKIYVHLVYLKDIFQSSTSHGVIDKLIGENQFADRVEINSTTLKIFSEAKPLSALATDTELVSRYDLGPQRECQNLESDYDPFDYIIAIQKTNLPDLNQWLPSALRHKFALLARKHNSILKQVLDPIRQRLIGPYWF